VRSDANVTLDTLVVLLLNNYSFTCLLTFSFSYIFRLTVLCVLDTALEWVSEHPVRAYTTPDSVVSYLNPACAQMARLHRRLLYDT